MYPELQLENPIELIFPMLFKRKAVHKIAMAEQLLPKFYALSSIKYF